MIDWNKEAPAWANACCIGTGWREKPHFGNCCEVRPTKTEWVDGLPPIGTHVEIDDDGSLHYGAGESGEVIAHVENTAVIRMSYGLGCFTAKFLRPIRTPEEKQREELSVLLAQPGLPMDLAEAILSKYNLTEK